MYVGGRRQKGRKRKREGAGTTQQSGMLSSSGRIPGNEEEAKEDGYYLFSHVKSLFVGGAKPFTESFNTDRGGLFRSDDEIGQSVGQVGRGENRIKRQRRRGAGQTVGE